MIPPSAKPSRSSTFTFSQGMYVTPRSTSQNCLYSCFTPLLRAHAIWIRHKYKCQIKVLTIIVSINYLCAQRSTKFHQKNPKQNKNISVSKGHEHLNDFGANLKGASTEFLAGTVCILSVHHADVSTASGRNHLLQDTQRCKIIFTNTDY